jgi:osmotically-inducible protein OsmY
MRLTQLSTPLSLVALVIFLQPAKAQSRIWSVPVACMAQAQESPTPAQHPQDKSEANSLMESNLRSAFSGDPILSGADIQTSVDDVTITLSGSVQSEGQHRRALALAAQFAPYRKIVDKLTIK